MTFCQKKEFMQICGIFSRKVFVEFIKKGENFRKKEFKIKDLITVGIFTEIYFVCFLLGMIGYIQYSFFTTFFLPLICGIPFMLFLSN
jgi:hypothetical protein